MKKTEKNQRLLKLAYAGLMAALCYVGYTVFPAIDAAGTKIHVGNAFVVLGALLLGGVYGGFAGAIGLSIADILGGFAATAPRTFICKLLIGLIVGLVAHKVSSISHNHDKAYIVRWSIIAAVAGLAFNCVFEPVLKYIWYTILIPNADKAQSAIGSLLAVTSTVTVINAVTNSIIGVIIYLALRPVLFKAGLLGAVDGNYSESKTVA